MNPGNITVEKGKEAAAVPEGTGMASVLLHQEFSGRRPLCRSMLRKAESVQLVCREGESACQSKAESKRDRL